jgi:hypothetical protein
MLKKLLLAAVLMSMVVGCKKSGGVTAADLYRESAQAAQAYGSGQAAYKPKSEAIHIQAKKGVREELPPGVHPHQGILFGNVETIKIDTLIITATGVGKDGITMEYNITVPVKWLGVENKEKFAALDGEFQKLGACAAKNNKNGEANPLVGDDGCTQQGLIHNGHPGTFFQDAGAPHMGLSTYDESKNVNRQ